MIVGARVGGLAGFTHWRGPGCGGWWGGGGAGATAEGLGRVAESGLDGPAAGVADGNPAAPEEHPRPGPEFVGFLPSGHRHLRPEGPASGGEVQAERAATLDCVFDREDGGSGPDVRSGSVSLEPHGRIRQPLTYSPACSALPARMAIPAGLITLVRLARLRCRSRARSPRRARRTRRGRARPRGRWPAARRRSHPRSRRRSAPSRWPIPGRPARIRVRRPPLRAAARWPWGPGKLSWVPM